jgi:hypothetical protein
VPGFAGLKITADRAAARRWGLNAVTLEKNVDRLLTDRPGLIGWGGNSGFHAMNMAVQFGVRALILVGFDMRLDRGLHWHGRHPRGLNNPTEGTVARWRRVVDGAAPRLAELGVTVINTSTISALGAYPKMSLEEALACCA